MFEHFKSEKVEIFNGCDFCALETRPQEKFVETPNFRIVVNPYYLVPGHSMIISKSHYGCVGELPEPLFKEFLVCKKILSDCLVNRYQVAPVFYEHGRVGVCMITENDNPCEHLHFHALPLNIAAANHFDPALKSFAIDIHKIREYYERYGSYLYFEDHHQGHFFVPGSFKVPPHYMATVISTLAAHPEMADWQSCQPKWLKASEIFDSLGLNHCV